jgi:hypothetical protein
MIKFYKILSNKAVAAFRKGTVGTLCMIVMTLFIMSTGCANDEKEKEEKEPAEISFMEYSLTGANCQWANLDSKDRVIVINNKPELEKYIACIDGSYPEIDFAKNTLLLTCGHASQNVSSISTTLLKCSATEYELKVTVVMGNFMVIEGWYISIIVSKIPNVTNINLKIDYSELYS